MRGRTLLLGLGVTAAACAGAPTKMWPSPIRRSSPTSAITAAAEAKADAIVFVSERTGRPQVFAQQLDGSAARQLTHARGSAFAGPIGPRGEILVITSVGHDEAAREQLHLLSEDGLVPLGAEHRFVRNPVWLPDGSGVIYEADERGFRNLVLHSFADASDALLTACEHGCFEPAPSPDGQRVAFASPDPGDGEVFVLDRESGHVQRLTWSPGMDRQPVWSPDGKRLAFVSSRGGRPRVFVMGADGSTPRPLRAEVGADLVAERDPVWSPDGAHVAFVTHREGRSSIAVARASDGSVVATTAGRAYEQHPSFSPDGRRIIFSSNRHGGEQDVYSIASDGTDLQRLTDGSANWLPRWLRTGEHISLH